MAEAYDEAIRRRLGIINQMGTSAPDAVQARARAAYSRPAEGNGAIVGQVDPSQFNPGFQGHKYNGPRGNQQALINFGKYLQSQGFRISENSYFNGGRRITGGHTSNSRHYRDRAIDVNRYPGTSRREQQAIDKIVGLARLYGLRSIWRQKGHFNHAHFDY